MNTLIRFLSFIACVISVIYTFPFTGKFWNGIFEANNSHAAKGYAFGIFMILFSDFIAIGYITVTLIEVKDAIFRRIRK